MLKNLKGLIDLALHLAVRGIVITEIWEITKWHQETTQVNIMIYAGFSTILEAFPTSIRRHLCEKVRTGTSHQRDSNVCLSWCFYLHWRHTLISTQRLEQRREQPSQPSNATASRPKGKRQIIISLTDKLGFSKSDFFAISNSSAEKKIWWRIRTGCTGPTSTIKPRGRNLKIHSIAVNSVLI